MVSSATEDLGSLWYKPALNASVTAPNKVVGIFFIEVPGCYLTQVTAREIRASGRPSLEGPPGYAAAPKTNWEVAQ